MLRLGCTLVMAARSLRHTPTRPRSSPTTRLISTCVTAAIPDTDAATTLSKRMKPLDTTRTQQSYSGNTGRVIVVSERLHSAHIGFFPTTS
jgi:hypothetical protein